MKYSVEMTDTFGGEANYSWVRRATIEVPDNASDKLIVRRAKAALDITGLPCRREEMGEMIVLRPSGVCWIVFIQYLDPIMEDHWPEPVTATATEKGARS